MFIFGLILVIISVIHSSSFLAILGVSLFFCGFLFLNITPTKQVPLAILCAASDSTSDNIERIINELRMSESGIYLPPRNLKNPDSSLVFIPQNPETLLPYPDETADSWVTNRKDGALIIPPGAGLCQFLDHELNASFTKMDLNQLQITLPKLLVEDVEFAENVEIEIRVNIIVLQISGSVFDEFCRRADSRPKTHKQVGCLLSSAVACALAKASGKPVIIQSETHRQETKTTKIEYQILEEKIIQSFSSFTSEETVTASVITQMANQETKISKIENKSDEEKIVQSPSPGLEEPTRLKDSKVKSSRNENNDPNVFEIEISSGALSYLKKTGNVYILTAITNPQYAYYKIKGYDADSKLIIKFEEFVEICKTNYDSQTNPNNQRTEYATKTFDVTSPTTIKPYDLTAYVAKSGYTTVDDWLKTLKTTGEIPECSTGHKTLFIYYIQAIRTT